MTFRSSRRRFIAAGAAAGCAALLPGALARAAVADVELTASRFRPFVGTRFVARASSETAVPVVELSLRAVRPLARPTPGIVSELAQERSFELVFGTDALPLAQDVYEMTHPKVGSFAAFLVPSRDGTTLLATFNRLS
jgi:hypothetical protein